MRCLERNKQPFYYSTYVGKEEMRDENGYLTGEYKVIRTIPVKSYGNISSSKGRLVNQAFGSDLRYDKVLILDNYAPQMNEYTVFWIDRLPELDKDGKVKLDEDGNATIPYNYVVKQIGKSINSTSIALSKVDIDETGY